MPPGDLRAAFLSKPWHRFLNETSGTIPPFAILRVTGASESHDDIRFTCAQPNSDQKPFYLVNGPHAVAAGLEGLCTTLTQGGYALYDTGSPAVGEEWGPQTGSWSLTAAGTGFFIAGGTRAVGANSAVVAVQLPSGSATPATEIVQVWDSGSAVGDEVAANADGYVSGRIRRWADPNMLTLSSVWIRFVDQHDRLDGDFGVASMTFKGDFHGPARLSGVATSDGSTRPVYVCTHNDIQESIGFELNEDMGESTADLASAIVEWSDDIDAEIDDVVTVHDDQQLFPKALAGAKGWAKRNRSLDYETGSFVPYWQVWVSDQQCFMGDANLNGTLCGEFVANITGFRKWSYSLFGQDPTVEPDTAYNPGKHRGKNGRWVKLDWGFATDPDTDEVIEGWVITDIEKEVDDICKRIEWDSTDGCWYQYLHTVALETCEEERREQVYCPPVCDV